MPNSASASSVRPEPSRPMMPSTSPLCKAKETSSNSPPRVGALASSTGGRPARCRAVTRVIDAIARHQLGQTMVVDLDAAGKRADLASVAKHGDAFGDLDDFLEPVADEDDRHAKLLQAANIPQQLADLMAGQRRGRFVHEQQARVDGKTAADGDDLALGDRRAFRRARRAAGCASSRAKRRGRGCPHRLPRRRPRAAAEFVVDGDVLEHASGSETARGPDR